MCFSNRMDARSASFNAIEEFKQLEVGASAFAPGGETIGKAGGVRAGVSGERAAAQRRDGAVHQACAELMHAV